MNIFGLFLEFPKLMLRPSTVSIVSLLLLRKHNDSLPNPSFESVLKPHESVDNSQMHDNCDLQQVFN
jgi:hypothetical protein